MKCPSCGAEIKNNEKVCSYCGSQISAKMLKEQEAVNKEGCLKCGSTNIRYNREKQGEIKRKNSKQIVYRTIGICNDCGNTWVSNQNSKSNASCLGTMIIGLLCLGFFPIPITIKTVKSKKLKKGPKIAIISTSWAIYIGYLAFIIILGLKSEKAEDTSINSNVVIEENEDSEKSKESTIIEVEKITISSEKELFFPGETEKLYTVIEPTKATNKELEWKSDDETVAIVDKEGKITAVGEEKTIIKATSLNGISDSLEITVDGSKREMNIKVKHPRDDDNNIGDEWNYYNEVNGDRVSAKTIILSSGDELTLYSKYTEEDENPDEGEGSKKYTVTEEDLINGFDVTFDFTVTENGGRNSGKSAHFNVTYSFVPK